MASIILRFRPEVNWRKLGKKQRDQEFYFRCDNLRMSMSIFIDIVLRSEIPN